jgi:hypothetical protein
LSDNSNNGFAARNAGIAAREGLTEITKWLEMKIILN